MQAPAPSLRAPAPSPPAPESAPATATFLQLTLVDVDAELESRGLPAEGLALIYDAAMKELLSSAHSMLMELLGTDAGDEVKVDYHSDWDESLLPLVGNTLIGTEHEQQSVTLAVCEARGCWAVGLGGPFKSRQQTSKLALCVALAPDSPHFAEVAGHSPAFAELCEDIGYVPEGFRRQRAPSPRASPQWAPPAKRQRPTQEPGSRQQTRSQDSWHEEQDSEPVCQDDYDLDLAGGAGGVAAAPGRSARDVPFWLALESEEGLPESVLGLPLEVLAVSTEGNKRKGIYKNVDNLLPHLLETVGAPELQIKYEDDANWELFPAVGAMLRTIMGNEECMCVAISEELGLWAVGVGMKSKCRRNAAMVAMATIIALSAPEISGMEATELGLEEYPAFADFVAEARAERGEVEAGA